MGQSGKKESFEKKYAFHKQCLVFLFLSFHLKAKSDSFLCYSMNENKTFKASKFAKVACVRKYGLTSSVRSCDNEIVLA